MKKGRMVLIAFILLIAASYVFSGKRTNPPVEHEVAWDSPETKAVFQRACADCHSHETTWPWYSKFAPVSWRVIEHVEEGREHFNISMSDMGDADEAAEVVEEGEMPLDDYVKRHPEAQLTPKEKIAFIAGLVATFGEEKH